MTRVAARLTAPVLASAAIAGCSGVTDRFVRLPELSGDVAYVGAIVLDASGERVASTGLVRRDPSQPLRVPGIDEERAAFVEVVGYTRAAIASTSPPGDDVLASDPLVRSEGCAPRLPDPAVSSRFVVASGDPAPDQPMPLSADWLAESCPDIHESAAVDVQCRLTLCPATIAQSRCTVDVDLSICDFGRFRASIDYNGRLCGASVDMPTCTFEPDPTEPSATIECTTPAICTIRLYGDPPPIPIDVTTFDVIPGAEPQIDGSISDLALRTWHSLTGYFSDAALVGDELVIATHDGRFDSGAMCSDPRSDAMIFVDTASGRTTRTATAPPCLALIIPDPAHGGLIAPYGPGEAPRIGRFSSEGRIIQEWAPAFPEQGARFYWARDAATVEALDEVMIIYQWAERADIENKLGTLIVGVDRTTLETRLVAERPAELPWSIAFGEGVLAFTDDTENRVLFIDPATGAERGKIDPVPHLNSVSVGRVRHHPASHTFLLAVTIEEPTLHVFETPDRVIRSHVFYEQSAAPLEAVPWPADPALALIGAASYAARPPRDVYVALLDPRKRILPGAVRIGFGVIGSMIEVGQEIWVTLPWEAKIARIRPR